MMIRVTCPRCREREYRVSQEQAAKGLRCPTCKGPLAAHGLPASRNGPPPVSRTKPNTDAPKPKPPRTDASSSRPGWVHLGAILLVILGPAITVIRDMTTKAAPVQEVHEELEPEPPLDFEPRIAVHFHDQESKETLVRGGGGIKADGGSGAIAVEAVVWEPSMRFGLKMLKGNNHSDSTKFKQLTREEDGKTNNTCVRLDAYEGFFGEKPWRGEDGQYLKNWSNHCRGRWLEGERDIRLGPDSHGERAEGRKSLWVFEEEKVRIAQTVEIVRGDQTRLLDTCLVRYRIENQDSKPHEVGLRFLLDTLIGDNDAAPFMVAGAKQLCDTNQEFSYPNIPEYIQALETDDLEKPGTIGLLRLRLGGRLDPPDRVTLGAWPDVRLGDQNANCRQEKTLWDVPVLPIKALTPGDSAVVIYWDKKRLDPGSYREVGFAYGLGSISSTEGQGKLAVTASQLVEPEQEFTLTAYVKNPMPNQTVTLTLPDGFELRQGEAVQSVPPLADGAVSRNSIVSWRVKAKSRAGSYSLKVETSTGLTQTHPVRVKPREIFK